MRNFKDQRTNIFPSTMRRGKELPSRSALDSPSVLSKLATPTPAIDPDMSHVIDDATSAMHDACDETTSLLDDTMTLGEFRDEQLARHYCRMLLTRHYDQRPFDGTMCDAIIANGGVKNRQKCAKRLR